MACLMSLQSVMPVMQKDQITELIVPTLITACTDAVPNVRFTVARILHKSKGMIDNGVLNVQLLPRLKDLMQDSDRDVAYFAAQAFNE